MLTGHQLKSVIIVLQFGKESLAVCLEGFICQHLCQTSNNPVGALRPACAHRPAAAATMKRAHRVCAAATNVEAAIQTLLLPSLLRMREAAEVRV